MQRDPCASERSAYKETRKFSQLHISEVFSTSSSFMLQNNKKRSKSSPNNFT